MKTPGPFGAAFVSVVALYWSAAVAYVDSPLLTPQNPTELTPITAQVIRGGCDALVIPPAPVVVRAGAVVELRVGWIGHTDPSLCTFGDVTTSYALGLFAPGHYELRIIGLPSPGGLGPTLLAATTFDVAAASAQSVPASGWPTLLLLAGLLAGAAATSRRRLGC